MLHIDWAALFQSLPAELATVLIAMIPIAELRGAIPVAMTAFDMSWWAAYGWAVFGNLIPAVFLLLFLEPVAHWLSRHFRFFDRFFTWLFARTRKRFTARAGKYGTFLALVLFVAIPLPVTGAWTGSAAAFLFGVPFRRAMGAIITGVLIAGSIVTIATAGISQIF